MNPRTQECFGLFGYGNGWFIKEGSIAAKAASQMGAPPPAAFCNKCVSKNQCWAEHRKRVGEAQPIEVAAFTAAMDQAKAAGESGGAFATRQAAAGRMDPWLSGMLANTQRGAVERVEADLGIER